MLNLIIFVIVYGLFWGAWRWWDGRGYGPGWIRLIVSVILALPLAESAYTLTADEWISWGFFALILIGIPYQWVMGYDDWANFRKMMIHWIPSVVIIAAAFFPWGLIMLAAPVAIAKLYEIERDGFFDGLVDDTKGPVEALTGWIWGTLAGASMVLA